MWGPKEGAPEKEGHFWPLLKIIRIPKIAPIGAILKDKNHKNDIFDSGSPNLIRNLVQDQKMGKIAIFAKMQKIAKNRKILTLTRGPHYRNHKIPMVDQNLSKRSTNCLTTSIFVVKIFVVR